MVKQYLGSIGAERFLLLSTFSKKINTSRYITRGQIEFSAEWRVEVTVQSDSVTINSRKLFLKIASFCAESDKRANTEHTMRINAKQIILCRRQIDSFDHLQRKIIGRMIP